MEENSSSYLSDLPDYTQIIRNYTKHWLWFLISIVTTLLIAYLYIRYTTPQYEAKAKVQIVGEGTEGSELSVFKEMNFLSEGESKVKDEIEIINSRSNFIELVERLGINVKVSQVGKIKDRDLYGNLPIEISFISSDSIPKKKNTTFFIEMTSMTRFVYRDDDNKNPQDIEFGTNFNTPLGDVVITPITEKFKKLKGSLLRVEVSPAAKVAETYRNKVIINPADKVSNILYLTLKDPVQEKAIDILEQLVNIYNENGISDRKAVADRTSEFIEERIKFIYENLSDADASEENFRTQRGLTNIASEADINLSVGANTQQELNSTITQLKIAESMKNVVNDDQEYNLLPSNIGLSDASVANTTSKYNQLISERNRLLKSSNEKNPIIVNLNQEINGLKKIMQSSLDGMIQNLDYKVKGLNRQQSRVNSRIYSTPKNQRALRDITRKQETTEALYLYLLQTREEAQITYASSKAKSKIIDSAYGPNELPISPKKPIIYLGAIFLGVLLPFSVIFIQNILDNKVHSMLTLEKIVGEIPVLGELPKMKKKRERSIKKNDRSTLAESFRIISTNLEYVLNKSRTKKNNIIYVTSSIPGEGKTFVSSNLAMILASKDSKVLLIGADIRNPKINSFFSDQNINQSNSKKNVLGLTDFLYKDSLSVKDVTSNLEINSEKIEIIYSGKIPPNPAELLKSPRMEELMTEVSEAYDYVIVDTAPVMLVADTLRISKFANLTIYVSKAGETELRMLEYPIKLSKEGKIKNLAFVVNQVKSSNLGYYGKYGYGY